MGWWWKEERVREVQLSRPVGWRWVPHGMPKAHNYDRLTTWEGYGIFWVRLSAPALSKLSITYTLLDVNMLTIQSIASISFDSIELSRNRLESSFRSISAEFLHIAAADCISDASLRKMPNDGLAECSNPRTSLSFTEEVERDKTSRLILLANVIYLQVANDRSLQMKMRKYICCIKYQLRLAVSIHYRASLRQWMHSRVNILLP